MNKEAIKYYKIIGRINTACSKADSFGEALKSGIAIMTEEAVADFAALWYFSRSDGLLHPYYWTYREDITSVAFAPGEGNAGKAFETETVVTEGNKVWVPFSDDFRGFGCLELAKESGPFLDEELDIVRILTTYTEMALSENARFPENWQKRELLMSVKDVTREFQSGDTISKVLKGISFDIFKGEFVAFLGESGCGKSTLLNIIGGMDSATSGTVTFGGRDLGQMSQDELTLYRRNNIGFIFQSYNLMPNLNARQNLDLIAELVEDPMDTMEALRLVGLDGKHRSYPSQLSGGQQQRISIARAIVKKPKLILADEPTAALDYATSIEVLHTLEEIKNSGTTLVMVTHNEEITRMADRVLRFRGGWVSEITVNANPAHAEELVW